MLFYFLNKKDPNVFTKIFNLEFQEFSIDNEWKIGVIEKESTSF